MYRVLPLIIYVILFGAYSSCAQSTDSLIKDIRAKYQTIRSNVKSYDTKSRDEWDESTEGGQIIGYYKKKDLKLIEGFYFGETGKLEIEYYFDNGLLFFVFEKHYTYNRPIYWDEKHMQENNDTVVYDPRKTKIKLDRYYFHKEKLFRWLDNEKEVDLSPGTNTHVGQELITRANKLQDKLKK